MSGQLKEVRERIKSVNSTQQITKAMKMVSAANLRRAQQAITELRPYANKLDAMLRNILGNLDGDASTPFAKVREVKKAAIVVVTSNRGLAGAFNTNIIKQAIEKIDGEFSELHKEGNLEIIAIGKKSNDALKKRYGKEKVNSEFADVFFDLRFENVSRVSQYLMESFKAGTFDKVIVCYSQFKNAGMQFPIAVNFLPVDKEKVQLGVAPKKKANYLFEPNEVELMEELVPTILQTTFQKFVLDTHASEHGARMTAMDKATENAEELIKELKINYNKARQEAITKELSEIVGGAAALGG